MTDSSRTCPTLPLRIWSCNSNQCFKILRVFILLPLLPLAAKYNLLSCCVADNKSWLAWDCPAEFTAGFAELSCIERESNYLLSLELWILERCLIKKKIFKTAPLNSAHEENEQVTGTDNRFLLGKWNWNIMIVWKPEWLYKDKSQHGLHARSLGSIIIFLSSWIFFCCCC